VLVVLTIVVLIVTAPLRRAGRAREAGSREAGAGQTGGAESSDDASSADDDERSSAIAELEAERDAKYREIRDAELDHRTGKLSDADFEAVDQTLRAEAIEILHQLDRERGVDPESSDAVASAEHPSAPKQPPADTR